MRRQSISLSIGVLFGIFGAFSSAANAAPSLELNLFGHGSNYRVEQTGKGRLVGEVAGFGVSDETQTIYLKRNLVGKWQGNIGSREVTSGGTISGAVKTCFNGKEQCFKLKVEKATSGAYIHGESENGWYRAIISQSSLQDGSTEIFVAIRDAADGDDIAEMRITSNSRGEYSGTLTTRSKMLPALVTLKSAGELEDETNYLNIQDVGATPETMAILLLGPLVLSL